MKGIFILPKDLSLNAYALIDNQVLRGLPINLGLLFNKYVNKFVTGYFKNGNWIKGEQSSIKRQIYLLKEERAKSFRNLKDLKDKKGKIKVNVREERRTVQKYLYEIIDEIIERCDADETFKVIRNIQNKDIRKELEKNLKTFLHANLRLSANLVDMNLYQSFYNRMKTVQANLEMQGYFVEEFTLRLNWRLVINLGAASVYETSLLFHRNYSTPYIPGSAVKGVTRHWAILKFAEKLQEAKSFSFEDAIKEIDKALENGKDLGMKVNGVKFSELIEIFGTQNKKGEVIFFDALPIIEQEKDFIVLDIMNVHYKPYYEASERELKENKEKTPGDWHSPTPIFFLAVEKRTKFRFALASKNKNEDSKNKDLVKKAKELLKEALKNIGIGAKTSAGYGYFEVK